MIDIDVDKMLPFFILFTSKSRKRHNHAEVGGNRMRGCLIASECSLRGYLLMEPLRILPMRREKNVTCDDLPFRGYLLTIQT
ncbi:hypothetical protein HanRHA438_Chr04g0161121 [Helianthus annuus]|nr:hypothetical protein HanRHA438_Chr04g0161121 [Helianthus annuus]